MKKNYGLIITASDQITLNTDKESEKNLKAEYVRRASNRQLVADLFNRNHIAPVVVFDVAYANMEDIILQTFKDTDKYSVNYIYINCHGNKQGLYMSLNGSTTQSTSYTELKRILDKVPGMKVLMIEACHSGESITRTRSQNKAMATPADVNQMIINTFSPSKRNSHVRSGELRASNYIVLTACHGDENAWGNDTGNYFTKAWCKGAGWDYTNSKPMERLADTDYDGFVSVKDLRNYTENKIIWDSEKKQNVYQNDMCYPENSTFPIFGDVPVCLDGKYDTTNNEAINNYFLTHGGKNGEYKYAIGPVQTVGNITCQNFLGGVIVCYADGKTVGHTKLRYILKRIRQTGKIRDGRNDYSLEMYIVVRIKQDSMWIEDYKRWPEYSKRKHGGNSFDIIYEGKVVDALHPKNTNVYYDTLTMNAESRIYLNIEVWDWDKTNANDHIRTYRLEFDINNGWGFDKPFTLTDATYETNDDIIVYTDLITGNDKIKLDFSIKNYG